MKLNCAIKALSLLLAFVTVPEVIYSQTFTWIGPLGGEWTDSTKWSGGNVPTAGGNAIVRPQFGGQINISSPTNISLTTLTLGSLAGTTLLELYNGNQTVFFAVTGTTTIEDDGQLYVAKTFAPVGGINNSGRLTVGGGAINGGIIQNSGLIRGRGDINAPVVNSGRIEVIDETAALNFSETLQNQSTGLVSIRNTDIRVDDGITNAGNLAITDGTVDVFADIVNTGDIGLSSGAKVSLLGDITQNGAVNLVAGSRLIVFGDFSGDEGTTGTGTIEILGSLSVGSSPASISFGGDVFLGGGADTLIELGGLSDGEFDSIDVGGTLSLGGTLDVTLLDDFVPTVGKTFEIATADDGIVGEFNIGSLPNLGPNLELILEQTTNSIVLSIVPSIPGDFDVDGDVDGRDFLVWQRGESPNPLSATDLAVWQANFGTQPLGAVSVPEPASLTMLFLAVMAFTNRRGNV